MTKDTWFRLTSTFLWELSELDATTKRADRSALKDFISRQEVTMRRAYARFDVTRPALASLIGTINEEGPGFLNDPTGNTRFAVVNLTAIDFGYTALDVNQVWAEAYIAYQNGEAWELTVAERMKQADINSEYENEHAVDGMVRRYYNLDPAVDVWLGGIDIILDLDAYGLKENQQASLMKLASFMKKWGHERKRIKGTWSYKGVSKKTGGIP
jgi:predicted P-loop ATPase